MRKQILTLIGALLLGVSAIWAQTAQSPAASNQKYTCVMHPEVVMDHPGNCPKCGMTLVPKKKESNAKPKSNPHESHDMHEHHGDEAMPHESHQMHAMQGHESHDMSHMRMSMQRSEERRVGKE